MLAFDLDADRNCAHIKANADIAADVDVSASWADRDLAAEVAALAFMADSARRGQPFSPRSQLLEN